MDDKKKFDGISAKFETLGTDKGEVVTLWKTPVFGNAFVQKTETHTYDDYISSKEDNHHGDSKENKNALLAIQQYKTEKGISLDTPILSNDFSNAQQSPRKELPDLKELNSVVSISKRPKGWEDGLFNGLETTNKGNVVASFIVPSTGKTFTLSEKFLDFWDKTTEDYISLLKLSHPNHNQTIEEHKESIQKEIDKVIPRILKAWFAREAIQEYKINNDITLDTDGIN